MLGLRNANPQLGMLAEGVLSTTFSLVMGEQQLVFFHRTGSECFGGSDPVFLMQRNVHTSCLAANWSRHIFLLRLKQATACTWQHEETEEAVQAGNKKYNAMLAERMKLEDELSEKIQDDVVCSDATSAANRRPQYTHTTHACTQGLEQQIEELIRSLGDTQAARNAQQREWEAKLKGMQEDAQALESSWKSKLLAGMAGL
eukprot:1085915-Pelagomonas_calceolata.AAC.2